MNRLPVPGLPLTAVLTVVCTPSLFYLFSRRLEETAVAYPLYLLSAYTLVAWAVRLPGAAKRIRAAVHRHPFGRRYLTDLPFRGRISLHLSTGVNLCYALFKLCAGIYYHSIWFGALAVYYLVLTAARVLLLRTVREQETDLTREYRAQRMCGGLLFVLNLALSAVTIQMVVDGRGYAYPGYLIFVVAGYAFYSVSAAIVNLVRFRKLNRPALAASKALGLATALVSMLSLQTAMFASFGGEPAFQRRMNALTGGAVCLFLFLLAVWMVTRTARPRQFPQTIDKEIL